MKLTTEQQKIIAYRGDMKINAVAGSGKTTTLIEYAKQLPPQARILYLAFNKSVKTEAEQKFAKEGLGNVKVETAHSLAFRYIVQNGSGYELQARGYKAYEIKEILRINVHQDDNINYILATHVGRFVAYFCNSAARKVRHLNYVDVITDAKAKVFVKHYYDEILMQTRTFLFKMYKREIAITHDYYLKQFQLLSPKLPYQYLLFDEGQDASPAMLDVFLKQTQATKVIVGDTHQQIYSWRYAINSLAKVDFEALQLTKSFRFDGEVAHLATQFLDWKKMFAEHESVFIRGAGNHSDLNSRATLARTNLNLLSKAIELVFEKRQVRKLYFEGHINSYTYAEEGASIYDVLSLYNGKNELIRDKMLRTLPDFAALEEYVEKAEEPQMKMLMEIVSKYKNELPALLKGLKEYHLPTENKEEADMIFSTVHRCKGMEYDEVSLEDDFVTPDKIRKILEENKDEKPDVTKLNEEVNLLYVAVTRSRNILHIPAIYQTSKSRVYWIKAKKSKPPRFSDLGKKSEENSKRFSLQDYLKRTQQELDNLENEEDLHF